MALITTFATLVTAIKDRANRTDMADADAEGFIQQGEARLNRLLRLPAMETTATLTTDSTGSVALPSDFLAMRAVYDANNVSLLSVTPIQMIETPAGASKVYALMAGNLRLAPAGVEALTALYYKKITALTSSNTTNWLLLAHPDIYLYAALWAYADWRDEADDSQKWQGLLNACISEVIEASKRDRFGGPLFQRGSMIQVVGSRV